MCILADLDSVIDANPKVGAIYMGAGALHAFWASRCARDRIPRRYAARTQGGTWQRTKYRDIPVIPTDWPHGWEIVEAA